MAETKSQDAIALLKEDHREVGRMTEPALHREEVALAAG